MDRPRRTALEALREIDRNGAYANLAARRVIEDQQLTGRDAAFVTELVFGTCRMLGSYDAIIELAAGRDLDSLQPDVLDILRLGAHQLLGTRVPARAAVDTSVALAAIVVGERVCGLVNAVLRKIARRDLAQWAQRLAGGDEERRRCLLTGHPQWIIDAFAEVLPTDEIDDLLVADNEAAEPTLVVRPGLCSRDELVEQGAEATRWSPWGGVRPGNPAQLPAVRSGRAGVQDEGSQLVCLATSRVPGLGGGRWLDMCAGPGGKSALLRGIAPEHQALLVAGEAQEHRAKLVSLALRRYPHQGHQVVVADGRRLPFPDGSFSLVLADVPCSGLGALRRRPESRWRRWPEDVGELAGLQRELLASALAACEPGGVVAYVTCSPHRGETLDVVGQFTEGPVEVLDAPALLPEVPGCAAHADPRFVQLWPHRHRTDAMFLALLRKAN
ncbi:16S rRNA (cytosine967-C5)-methyltransferase [Propionibacterium cyclohexanicum]|uniref:16S rRNA (Cytosine967-C5)-methyltransferase n=2 Tax=Propionibacterium cyclohexanicum TaxID=64702 RepID=A0A1H9Q0S0_9ACTN|nr:16S rRNA (cytosine967-C5)-methyltransferase [Propionibacterium cyclohexanicum]